MKDFSRRLIFEHVETEVQDKSIGNGLLCDVKRKPEQSLWSVTEDCPNRRYVEYFTTIQTIQEENRIRYHLY